MRVGTISTSVKPAFFSLALEVLLLERAREAADPELDAPADLGGHLATHDDVGDGEPPARLEDPERLAQDRVLVGGEVDDAVRDDHVDARVGERDRLDLAP